MTRNLLHAAFKVEMDKNSASVAFGGCPAFLPEEIDYWLNQGMFQELATKFTGHNDLQQPFEGSVKRTLDLEKLVRTDAAQTLTEGVSNTVELNNLLNSSSTARGRMFFVNAVLNWTKSSIKSSAPIVLVEHSVANNFLETYNNKPWIDTPVATIENNTLRIYYDPVKMAADTYTVDITYVKYPTLVDALGNDDMTEIPEYMQYEIINRAALLALEDIESRRSQTKAQLNTINE